MALGARVLQTCRLQNHQLQCRWKKTLLLQRFSTSVHSEISSDEREGPALELWTWGRGEAGQLGLGEENTERTPSLMHTLLLPRISTLAPMSGVLMSASSQVPSLLDLKKPQKMSHLQISEPEFVGNRNAVRRFTAASGLSGESRVQEVGIACGLFHSCLWENGNLWLWGKGDGGRLGTGSENSMYSPSQYPSLLGVKSVALGGLHSAAITEEGEVYTFGFGGFGALGNGSYERAVTPKCVDGSSAGMGKIVHVAAGGAHTAAVSDSGDLFTWGRDEGEGRLGHIPAPEYEDGVPIPVQVRGISDPVAATACGGFFTLALTSQGQLWSWGGSSNYELGRGERRANWRPRPVPEVGNTHLTQVACGGYHSAALTGTGLCYVNYYPRIEDGKVLTWGHGGHGQLGHGDLANARVPKVVEALEVHRCVFVACGGAWTSAVTEEGELYTWGKNRDCQLGVSGLMDTEMLPVLVPLNADKAEQDSRRCATAVAAGAHHGMCLVLRD